MPRFRKKPVVIEAIQWTGTQWAEVAAFHRGDTFATTRRGDGTCALNIATPDGVMVAVPGAWIIRGVTGERYPCQADIFEASYDAVEG